MGWFDDAAGVGLTLSNQLSRIVREAEKLGGETLILALGSHLSLAFIGKANEWVLSEG